ncbi:hypothetical protein BGX38DRAFT_1239783 [Terfezia claveryi]|nr:hypothetical protein BGX38DRAFT_1239783 [Terfezia claveryi]
MEIIERQNKERKGQEADNIKREKAESQMKRENLLHTISKKRTFNAVIDARNTVDLTHPGDVVESANKAEFYESLLSIPPPATSAEVTQIHDRLSRLENILEKLVSEISKGKD